jgi:hypothetical protein
MTHKQFLTQTLVRAVPAGAGGLLGFAIINTSHGGTVSQVGVAVILLGTVASVFLELYGFAKFADDRHAEAMKLFGYRRRARKHSAAGTVEFHETCGARSRRA